MIIIPATIAQELIRQAREHAPVEACGYLAGRDGTITERIPLRNTDASAEHFTLDPAEQFAAVRSMRTRGLKLIAVYHSHPVTPARPSQEDIRLAYDPVVSYVIVSLAGEQPDIRSFRIKEGVVENEQVTIGEGGAS